MKIEIMKLKRVILCIINTRHCGTGLFLKNFFNTKISNLRYMTLCLHVHRYFGSGWGLLSTTLCYSILVSIMH